MPISITKAPLLNSVNVSLLRLAPEPADAPVRQPVHATADAVVVAVVRIGQAPEKFSPVRARRQQTRNPNRSGVVRRAVGSVARGIGSGPMPRAASSGVTCSE